MNLMDPHLIEYLQAENARMREAIEMAENRLECALYGENPVCKHCVDLAQSYLQEALAPVADEAEASALHDDR